MEEHTVDLLRECDSGCAMAAESLEQIRDFVSDQGLWNEITASYEKHQDLELRIKKTLSAMEEQGKEPGKMASAWSWMSTEMRMMAKGGDKEAASIVTDGCNMGSKRSVVIKISIPAPQRPPWSSRTSSPGWKKSSEII